MADWQIDGVSAEPTTYQPSELTECHCLFGRPNVKK